MMQRTIQTMKALSGLSIKSSTPAHTRAGPLRSLLMSFTLLLILSPTDAPAGIVVTLPPLSGLVLMLDAEADIHCLLQPGADAHEFQLSPRQVQQLKQADLLLRSSFDDGHWSGLSLPGRSLDLWPGSAHAWLSPMQVRNILPLLAEALQEAAPQRKQRIDQALQQALAQCDSLDQALDKAFARYRKDGIIMQHNAWQGVMETYHVPVLGILESHHHGDNIRPRTLAAALSMLNKHPEAVLWGNIRHANRGLAWLSEHRKHRAAAAKDTLLLDPLGRCGQGWAKLMQHNLSIISR